MSVEGEPRPLQKQVTGLLSDGSESGSTESSASSVTLPSAQQKPGKSHTTFAV